MLQAEATSKMLKYAITEKKKKIFYFIFFFLCPNLYFLMPGSVKLYVQGELSIFFPHSLLFQGQTNVVARQAVSKKTVDNGKKPLKIPTLLGCAAQPSMKAVIWAQLISAGSVPCQQDPGWLLLAHPLCLSVLDPEGAYQLRCIALQGQVLPGIKWRLIGAWGSLESAEALPRAAALLTWLQHLLRALLKHPPAPRLPLQTASSDIPASVVHFICSPNELFVDISGLEGVSRE